MQKIVYALTFQR